MDVTWLQVLQRENVKFSHWYKIFFSSVIFLLCTEISMAGDYCKGFFNKELKYHRGFYCTHFCCGSVSEKYCCNQISRRFDPGEEDNHTIVDITSWNTTVWIMGGCIIGAIGLVGFVIFCVCCICCKEQPLQSRNLAASRIDLSLGSFTNMRLMGKPSSAPPSPFTDLDGRKDYSRLVPKSEGLNKSKSVQFLTVPDGPSSLPKTHSATFL